MQNSKLLQGAIDCIYVLLMCYNVQVLAMGPLLKNYLYAVMYIFFMKVLHVHCLSWARLYNKVNPRNPIVSFAVKSIGLDRFCS